MMVRCPQCGTTFDKDANEFCPNPGCGYPSAFILTPEAEPEEPEEMLRRPGEEATAEQPVVPPVVPQPTVVDPTPPTTSFAAPPPPPPRRKRSTGVYIGIGFAIGLVIVRADPPAELGRRRAEAGRDVEATSRPTTPDRPPRPS